MRAINTFQSLLQLLPGLTWLSVRRVPAAPPQQLDLGLDRITESGLPLRDAMAVRSAEFWLALGEPRVALRELDTLTDLARQNAWTMRTQLRARTFSASTGEKVAERPDEVSLFPQRPALQTADTSIAA